ncbi:MAG TPA: hypothetical protein ENH05_07900 [Rhizobiales bacterium]|nr:hypothetical protein [Hyphomicrobiales bacterium]
MTRLFTVKKTVSAAALALPLIAGFGAIASAHSLGACTDNVVDACNAAHPGNYDARIACVNNGITACQGHSHGGGGRPESASENLSSGSNPEQSRTPIYKKFRK